MAFIEENLPAVMTHTSIHSINFTLTFGFDFFFFAMRKCAENLTNETEQSVFDMVKLFLCVPIYQTNYSLFGIPEFYWLQWKFWCAQSSSTECLRDYCYLWLSFLLRLHKQQNYKGVTSMMINGLGNTVSTNFTNPSFN